MLASEVVAIAYIVLFVVLVLCGMAWLVWHAILSLLSHPSFPYFLAAPFVVGIVFSRSLPGFFRGRPDSLKSLRLNRPRKKRPNSVTARPLPTQFRNSGLFRNMLNNAYFWHTSSVNNAQLASPRRRSAS